MPYTKHMSLIATAAAFPMVASRVGADVLTFDNMDGSFVLVANANFFDVTLPASQQTLAVAERSVGYVAVSGGGSESPQADRITCGASIGMARSSDVISVTNMFGITTNFRPAQVFPFGGTVGAGLNFQSSNSSALFYVGGGRVHEPFLGQSPFTGFRLTLADGPHFGWVQWNFGLGPLAGGGEVPMYQPIRWAYETEPNVPITVVPAPAAAAIFAPLGFLVARRRRRL